MFNLKYSKLEFYIKFEEKTTICKNKVSALRGILGNSLALTNCLFDAEKRNCKECFANEKCLGYVIMNAKLKYKPFFMAEDVIAPIIIECNDNREKFLSGEILKFIIIILADTTIYLPYIINGIELAGIVYGLQGNMYSIKKVKNEFGKTLYDENGLHKDNIVISTINEYISARKRILKQVKGIELITPLRFKDKNKFSDEINEEILIKLLNRRIQTLDGLNNNKAELSSEIAKFKFSNKALQWKEYERYSNKQKRTMTFGGIVGRIEVNEINNHALELLMAGELLHIGKNTVFGLGKYKIY